MDTVCKQSANQFRIASIFHIWNITNCLQTKLTITKDLKVPKISKTTYNKCQVLSLQRDSKWLYCLLILSKHTGHCFIWSSSINDHDIRPAVQRFHLVFSGLSKYFLRPSFHFFLNLCCSRLFIICLFISF